MAKKAGKNKPKASLSRVAEVSQARHAVRGRVADSHRVACVGGAAVAGSAGTWRPGFGHAGSEKQDGR
jgi:hypothetical protein